jgi:Ala-tRNA(Pro) deacylase
MVLTAYFALSPVTGLSCHRHRRNCFRRLDTSVGVSGPHDFATRTAEACHISGDRLAKGVVLRRDGEYMLAVVPASHHLRLSELRTKLGDNVHIADETEINQLFRDCAHGAVPAVGKCYGLDIIVDDSIEAQPEICMEAGDHETLLHMSHAQFSRLTANALHGRF